MTKWLIHYPDRPAIPHDTRGEGHEARQARSVRKLAEAGHRKGAPATQIPHHGRINEGERPQ